MALVDSRGYRLTPDIAGSLSRGFQVGRQFTEASQQDQLFEQQQRQQQQQQALLGQIFTPQVGTPPINPVEQSQPQMPVAGVRGALGQMTGQPMPATQPAPATSALPAVSKDQAIAQLMAADPAMGMKVRKALGIQNQARMDEAARFSYDLQNTPMDKRGAKIDARLQALKSQGIDGSQTAELLDMDQASQDEALRVVQIAALPNEKRLSLAKGATPNIKAGVDAEGLPGFFDFSSGEARKIKGVAPTPKDAGGVSEVQSSKILDDGTVQFVRKDGTVEVKSLKGAEAEIIKRGHDRGVELQQQRAQGRETGKGSAKFAEKTFEKTDKLRENNVKLREVVANVTPENTGPLMSRLPSFRAESVRLDNLRNQLGLDVIGSVTFGALSEAELNMALHTALPTDLDGAELIQWANDKIASQEKLAAYLESQAIYLTKPGNTRASWIEEHRTKGKEPAQTSPASPKAPAVMRFNKQGQRIE